MSSFVIISFCLLVSQIICILNKFDNFTLYQVTAFNSRERALLHFLHVKNELIMFLNGITNEAALPINVIVDGCCTKYFEEKLDYNDIEYVKLKNNSFFKRKWDHIIDKTFDPSKMMPNLITDFYSWETLMLWVESKLQKFPVLKKVAIGKTFEKREIFVLKISSGKKNTAVFLMGGEDGKDWLSPAILFNFVTYILNHQLNVDLLVKHYDFYILPILNPDGYAYSTMKEWYWSGNRKVYFPKKNCFKNDSVIGINIDRNWYFSNDIIREQECDSIYPGSKSVSEEETESLAKFLNSIALQMLAFINVRSFENLVTIPYGYDHEYCNNYPVLLDIISSVHDRVIEEHNKTFFYGTAAAYFYNFTGNVADWVKKKLNTPIVYTFYMKSDDYFCPSASDIQPLTNQLSTMMKEILLLASSIYSPLFSHQIRHLIQAIVIIINILFTSII